MIRVHLERQQKNEFPRMVGNGEETMYPKNDCIKFPELNIYITSP